MADASTHSPLAREMAAPVAIDHRARIAVVGAILLAVLLAGLDQTVVGTALPRIVTDLQGSDRYVWVVNAYLLGSTVTIPVYGKLSDVYGRKAMLMVGVGLFLLGSGLSGLSQSMNQLIAFRALQGLGAGGIFPVAVAAVGDLYSPRERGRYQGMFGAGLGLSFLIGPFVGGWITDTVGWHWVFSVNVPFGLVALLALARLLPNRRLDDARARDLDYLGIAVFVAGVVPVLIGLTRKGALDAATGRLYDWTDGRVAGPIGLGAALLLGFVLVELRARHPIVPLDVFRNRNYAVSMVATFLFGVAGFIAIVFMPRFYQTVRGVSATTSGYSIWPLIAGLMAGSIGSGVLISRAGRYKWLIAVSGAALVVGACLMTHASVGTPDWILWAWMVLLGLGIGPAVSAFTVVVQSSVPAHRLGVASSTLTVIRQIGASIGLAMAGTTFASVYQGQLPSSLSRQGVPHDLVQSLPRLSAALQGVGGGAALLSHVLPPAERHLMPQILAGANDAFARATAASFWIAVVAGTAALISTLALRDVELQPRSPAA